MFMLNPVFIPLDLRSYTGRDVTSSRSTFWNMAASFHVELCLENIKGLLVAKWRQLVSNVTLPN